jgi:ribonuclease VapC
VIVVDTSALIAVLLNEPGAASFRYVLARSEDLRLSAVSDYEARLVSFRQRGHRLVEAYDELVDQTGLRIVAFDQEQSLLAFEAYRRYGKGNHPAALNFGDCASYALARRLNAPLLFKGNDFGRTDIQSALPAL